MGHNVNTGFDNDERLLDIRKEVLNPIAVKVANLNDKVVTLENESHQAFTSATKDLANKEIILERSGGGEVSVSLEGMFREGSDLELTDDKGSSYKNISKVHFAETTVHQTAPGDVEIHYNWGDIVPSHQDNLSIGKTGVGLVTKPKALFFKGPDVTIDQSVPDITTVGIPKIPDQMMATISSADTPVPINSIELDGNIGTSIIKDGKLTIDLQTGGGILSSDNFKGFFSSLGDIESQVADPKDGKSFAFAKDSKLGGQYYTPYFYVNGGWTELKQDPALLYSPVASATTQGVFSIKPSDKIQIDSNGQLDLDGLSTPQLPSHFKGFFTSIEALNAEVPRPVLHQDWAYVNVNNNGWLAYRSDAQGSARKWNVFAPLGSFAAVDRKEDPSQYAQVFGIYRNDSWDIDSRGILSLRPINTKTKIEIAGTSTIDTGEVSTIQFMSGSSYASIRNDKLYLNHPQRVIQYNSTWESQHNTEDYRGNIFFDTTSRTWMGWSDPSAQGAVGAKWTRIAHEDMSVEVKGLTRRVPWKTPEVIPGTDKDNGKWFHNGFTFVPKEESNLPDSFREKAGAYILTMAKGNEDDKFAAERYQVCYSDEDVSETYIRRLKPGSPGAELDWSPWLRTSFSKKDITDHENDPAAHRNVIKYHKVTSFSAKCSDFANQQEDSGKGAVRGDNCDLICDNYGYTEGTDYAEVPYDGKFRVSGGIALSGYSSGNTTLTQWSVILSVEKANSPGSVELLKSFKYVHSKVADRYPPMGFSLDGVDIKEGDKVFINIRTTDPTAVKNAHPNLYFVPIKSYFVVEDMNTRAGTKIGATYRKQLGNLNSYGNIEVKAHHTDYDVNKAVRVYGDKVNKTSVVMTES